LAKTNIYEGNPDRQRIKGSIQHT